MSSPTKELYSLRRSFSIIGLTGRMGSGNSNISKYLTQSENDFFNYKELRKPEEIEIKKDEFETNLFKRKYSICYNFYIKNHIQYDIIDYKKVLLLYVIDFFKNEENAQKQIGEFIVKWFKKSKTEDVDFPEIKFTPKEIKTVVLNNEELKKTIEHLKLVTGQISEVKTKKNFKILDELFFDKTSSFNIWATLLIESLEGKNQYLRTFFFHKIANNIRATGNPKLRIDEIKNPTTQYVYSIAKTINRLIKSYKSNQKRKNNCHLVINSLKNSLEIMFFKERYSAFYLMTINNQNNYSEAIKSKIPKNKFLDLTSHKLIDLDDIECSSSDFSKGNFFSPDVENCIQKAEIHIRNVEFNNEERKDSYDFYSVKEQLMKILSLIQQPGIITPSNQERCMLTAYNSKFNSGCISRQVGAVLTDSSFSIKSVGWNDVPKQSITCLLKNSEELILDVIDKNDMTYSNFEVKSSEYKYKLNKNNGNLLNQDYVGNNFHSNISNEIKNIAQIKSEGKNCTFCFKSMHNKFEGEKNQVHTRSLHAEENAMLQITKYGGQAILNGKLFTTASPCELCAKKACQIGVNEIYYIDPYPGISMDHVLKHGNSQPTLIPFNGIIGKSFNKLYEPLMSYKDELSLYK